MLPCAQAASKSLGLVEGLVMSVGMAALFAIPGITVYYPVLAGIRVDWTYAVT